MVDATLTVSEVLGRLQHVVVAEFPSPLWVRGEVTGFHRTSGGAVFFRLADTQPTGKSIEVGAKARMMMEIDRGLSDAGLGSLRDGVEVRVRGTVAMDGRRSLVRLALLGVDPTFTAGRLALDRAQVEKRMTADGSIAANARLSVPLVPLRIGLVTSRGSAAHGDFLDQLERSPFRFSVLTAHTSVQGETAPDRIAGALARFSSKQIDMLALVRGGGSKLDLSSFDTEIVARAIAGAPVPVITGIGHDMDRSVADLAAAIAEKTPSAAGEWLVARVKEYADRLITARHTIGNEAKTALRRHALLLDAVAADLAGTTTVLHRQRDTLANHAVEIRRAAREAITRNQRDLTSLSEWFSAIALEPTLRRGFSIVTKLDGKTVIKTTDQVEAGDRLLIRLADGTVPVEVRPDDH